MNKKSKCQCKNKKKTKKQCNFSCFTVPWKYQALMGKQNIIVSLWHNFKCTLSRIVLTLSQAIAPCGGQYLIGIFSFIYM